MTGEEHRYDVEVTYVSNILKIERLKFLRALGYPEYIGKTGLVITAWCYTTYLLLFCLLPCRTNTEESHVDNLAALATPTYNTTDTTTPQIVESHHYLAMYSGILGATLLLGSFRIFVAYAIFLKASSRLHSNTFAALLRCSMRFFDTNFSGRCRRTSFKSILVCNYRVLQINWSWSQDIAIWMTELIFQDANHWQPHFDSLTIHLHPLLAARLSGYRRQLISSWTMPIH